MDFLNGEKFQTLQLQQCMEGQAQEVVRLSSTCHQTFSKNQTICKMLNENHQHLQQSEYSIAGGGQPDYPAALSSLQHMDSEQLKVTQF